MSIIRAFFILLLSACVVTASLPVTALARGEILICESTRGGGYRFCRVETDNRVRLRRQLSRSDCQLGRSWGYSRQGIWVNYGCRAEFEYGDHGHHDRHGSSDKGAAIAGAVVGTALLAGIIAAAASKSNESPATTVPNWAIGTFRGYNVTYNAEVELRVYADGNVKGKVLNTGLRLEGYYRNDSIFFDALEFEIERRSNGFLLTQVNNRDNTVAYQRLH